MRITFVEIIHCYILFRLRLWAMPLHFFLSQFVRMDFTEAYSDRCSAVGLAAREGNIKLLKKLIKKGYSIDVPDNRGWMAIHEAAFQNKNECLKLLIQAGKEKCISSSDIYMLSVSE